MGLSPMVLELSSFAIGEKLPVPQRRQDSAIWFPAFRF